MQSFALTVNEAPSYHEPATSTFTTSTAGSFDFTSGGWPLPSYSVTGALPSGVTLPSTQRRRDRPPLSGTPRGGYRRRLHADGHRLRTGSARQRPRHSPHDRPADRDRTTSSTSFVIGSHGSFTCRHGGFPQSSLSTLTGPLPTGLDFHDNGDGTGTLSGTPAVGRQASTTSR